VFLGHSNSTINIPKLCFMEAVQSVLAAWDTLQKVVDKSIPLWLDGPLKGVHVKGWKISKLLKLVFIRLQLH
jgi:hypothetical protein